MDCHSAGVLVHLLGYFFAPRAPDAQSSDRSRPRGMRLRAGAVLAYNPVGRSRCFTNKACTMSWELLFIKILGGLFVASVFAGVIFLLRFLYGPKGKFREPEWDAWNEAARRQSGSGKEQSGEERKNEAALRADFTRYAESFVSGRDQDDSALRLKVEHTFRVLKNAEEIAGQEPDFADAGVARILRLAALFHDVGRFEQLQRYHTFADDLSCNHALLGVRVMREQNFLAGEARKTRALALAAVAAHNRFSVSKTLPDPLRPVLLGLRDADKLDILRIMADNLGPGKQGDSIVLLHLRDEPEACSPAVLKAFEEGRVALYRDMRYVNDFRIVFCTWLHDLHFPAARRIVRREGWLNSIIDGIEALPDLRARLHAFVDGFLAEPGAVSGPAATSR